MLIYVGCGFRRYADVPVSCYARQGWEFQAVLRGSITPVYPDGPDLPGRKKLWLFPPGHFHGWTAGKNTAAEIAVIHSLSVPEPLPGLLGRNAAPLEVSLTEADCRRLRTCVRQAWHYWKHPGPATMICHEQALMELSLLVWESAAQPGVVSAPERSAWRTVQEAMAIFAENLSANPSQEELARRVNVSSSHLRRLFHEVLQSSPKRVLDQLRFQRAIQLMADPEAKLEAIGEACGFHSASAFSRAFKTRFGCSPQAWRG